METLDLIAYFGMAVVVIASALAIMNQQQKLADPDDLSVVELDTLSGIYELAKPGQYLVRVYRQSGNLYKDDQLFNDREAAVKAGVATFKRAKIPYAVVEENTLTDFVFRRPFHNHRGKAEGKKVAKVEIFKIE
ncbi:hypothetical protein [Marinobacterium lutimaris]|uniref:Uncharacterized protein n=1 Tax=Marinobacterium lutimaris TaxID=568106 RepID=A0A1H5UU47_9GAMM|nr:hypothetical protein [Marinobacterium lutimaris]SEF78569.1 hypothetical protein SAMN05444390_101509 [Marinobacterium lutimaris]